MKPMKTCDSLGYNARPYPVRLTPLISKDRMMEQNKNLVCICYEGTSGSSDIRTCYIEGILHFSLKDILVALNKENRELGAENPTRNIPSLLRSVIRDLDDDEFVSVPVKESKIPDETELFITQPGLNRVMGNDKTKAGRKFQRWLYHEVVPSLTKHGVYPPPASAQGSALSQMAEIVAQNSRMLADTIYRQDQIENELLNVKNDVQGFTSRLSKLEEDSTEQNYMLSVRSWFDSNQILLTQDKEKNIVNWCENLSLRLGKQRIPCASGDRYGAKFHPEIIMKARELVEDSNG